MVNGKEGMTFYKTLPNGTDLSRSVLKHPMEGEMASGYRGERNRDAGSSPSAPGKFRVIDPTSNPSELWGQLVPWNLRTRFCAPPLLFHKENLKDNRQQTLHVTSLNFLPNACSPSGPQLEKQVVKSVLSGGVFCPHGLPSTGGSPSLPAAPSHVPGLACPFLSERSRHGGLGPPGRLHLEIHHWRKCCLPYMLLIKLRNCFSTQTQRAGLCGSQGVSGRHPIIVPLTRSYD